MVYYLISEGADMNCCSTVTKSPLITLPAYSANYELTSFLIEKGADVNLYGDGSSALTYSVSNSMADECLQIEVFNLLLENGADPYNGMTAYEFAEDYSSQARADTIKKHN